MNSRSFSFLVLSAVLMLSAISLAATYGGGSGTAEDPYQIWTPDQMNSIGINSGDWSSCFKLMDDIDMSAYTGTQYKIIGTFRGTFDGNHHVIRNLTYSSTTAITNIGLFGIANGATIVNLGLENINFSVAAQYVGGLAGQLMSCTVTNCFTSGAITNSNTKELCVGGLAGYQHNGTITSCHSAGTVVGTMPSSSYSWNVYAGGLVGQQYIGIITHCLSSADVTATSTGNDAYAGGLVGYQPGNICNISNSGSTGGVNAVNSYRSYAGGLIGYRVSSSNSLTNQCFSTGSVTASTTSRHAYAGGLIGYLEAPITDCFCTGSVTCSGKITYTGGLAGYATYASLIRCYSTGLMTANATNTAYTGGSIGYRNSTNASKCFWDTVTSGLSNESGHADYTGGIYGESTTQMKTEITFTDMLWDFVDTWAICEKTNYPRLQWQIPAVDWLCPDGVNMEDFDYLVERWLRNDCSVLNDYCNGVDMNYSGSVDITEFALFAQHWLEGI
ncbi:MAG: GLUG motif-containing protein [Anaerohalosphaeraceae bacterium]